MVVKSYEMKSIKNLISLIILFSSINGYGQTCTVSAGNDISICEGQSAYLNGSGTGIEFHWQAAPGLTDTNNIHPLVNPRITTSYILESDFTTSINLITNPNFSAGNMGFTSGYRYKTPPNYTVGEYWVAIGSQIPSWNPGLASCDDHTTGNGQMMIVNGATITNVPVWCQTVTIKPNTKYEFTCWLQSLSSPNPAIIQLSINDIQIGNILTAAILPCVWQQFYFIWNSDSNTTANICIVNKNTIGPANDFALDDISLSPLCAAYDSVTVVVNPISTSNNPQTICFGETYTFNSHIYSGSGIFYDTLSSFAGCDSVIITELAELPLFSSNNPQTICEGQTYTFNSHNYSQAGLYFDTLITIFGCDSIIKTSIIVNPLPAIVFTHPDDICVDAPFLILESANPVGGMYNGTGVINNTFNPQNAGVGKHPLTYSYTDPLTNCTNYAEENITVNPLPVIEFSIDPKSTIIEYSKITFIDSTPGAVAWLWNFGDGSEAQLKDVVHEYKEIGNYNINLLVIDSLGCKNEIEDQVIIDREYKFYIPNTFTPNNDGINDLFIVSGVGIIKFNMRIFNRWGILIFETNDINNSWNGKNFTNGTYIYKIKLSDYSEKSHEFTGRVLLIR